MTASAKPTQTGRIEARRRRGQPLVVLFALALGWSGARITSLSGEGAPNLPETMLTVGTAEAAPADAVRPGVSFGPQSFPAFSDARYGPYAMGPEQVRYVPVFLRGAAPTMGAYRPGYATYLPDTPAYAAQAPGGMADEFARDALTAPVRNDERLPAGFTASAPPQHYGEPGSLLGTQLGLLAAGKSHWSGDGWALLRRDGKSSPEIGTLPATYGASQTGAVVRYRFSLQDPRKLSAYLRSTASLGTISETAVALGLSARPVPAVPIVAAIEGRVTEQGGSSRVQPAVLAVTELPPLALPNRLRAEIYGQAGYVGGRYATPFADGQVRIDRGFLKRGRIEARIGAGAWGGIQKGASRLDAGPGATLSLPLTGTLSGRVALDWRFRVAGNAEPDSGPALTLATGF